MELIDYLRIARRRAWILILLPVLAGGIVTGYIVAQPSTYTAKATVAAPALVGGVGANQYTGADGPKAFDSNFDAALTSPALVDQVAQQTHVSAAKIQSGLSAVPLGSSTLGTSTILQVIYTTTSKRTAATVAETAASDTLQFLFKTQADQAQANVTSAQNQLNAAESALQKFSQQTGIAQPDHSYDLLVQEINSLQVQQLQDQASGNPAAAAGLAAAISAKQAQLTALAPEVQQYLGLVDRKNAAITNLNNIQQTAYQASDQLHSADPSSTISVTKPEKVSPLSSLVLTAGPAAAIGVFLAVGLVFVLEVLSRRAIPQASEEAVGSRDGRDATSATEVPDDPELAPGPAQGTLAPAASGEGGRHWERPAVPGATTLEGATDSRAPTTPAPSVAAVSINGGLDEEQPPVATRDGSHDLASSGTSTSEKVEALESPQPPV